MKGKSKIRGSPPFPNVIYLDTWFVPKNSKGVVHIGRWRGVMSCETMRNFGEHAEAAFHAPAEPYFAPVF
jgi:hypothetical protein